MKKIILLFVVGFLFFSVKSLVADEISDCLELEQLKAQREEIPYREAVEIALKICSIKANLGWTTDTAKDFDICLKNERIKAAREEISYSRAIENSIESCSNQAELKKRITKKAEKEAAAKQRKAARESPIFAIDVFNGNRTIKKLNIDFSTFGVLLDYYFTPNLSFTASYFLSSGENEINTNRDETYDVQVPIYVNENYDVQVPIYVNENYDVQVPYYVDETYDGMEAYTYTRLIKPEVVSRPNLNHYCAFRNSDNTECYLYEWTRDIVAVYEDCSDSDDGYVIIGNKKYCDFFGSRKPDSYLSNCVLDADYQKNVDFFDNCIQWTYQDTYDTETRYRPAVLTRQVIGGYKTETRTHQVMRGYKTETRTRQVMDHKTKIRNRSIAHPVLSNVNIREISFGGRLHFRRNDAKSGLDLFIGAGLSYMDANIEPLSQNSTSQQLPSSSKQKGSNTGFYTETGIKYIFTTGVSIGYYNRLSSSVFELNNSSLGKINWGGISHGLILGYAF